MGNASNADFEQVFDVGLTNASGEAPPLYGQFRRWTLGPQPMWLNFSDPTVLNLDRRPEDFDPRYVVIPEDYPADSWVYLLIVGRGLRALETAPAWDVTSLRLRIL